MKRMKYIQLLCMLIGFGMLTNGLHAQTTKKAKKKGEIYFSWGYNKEWYTRSNVHVKQDALGNDYTFDHIEGHDHPGWDKGLLHQAISIPQYNYRLGYIFNQEKGLAFEINFDHTKFIFADQQAHVVGTLNHRAVDTIVSFDTSHGFRYYLNNGANFLLFNLVKRWNVYESSNGNFKIDVLAKGGIGPVIPHVENQFFGQKNKPHFQFGGWNIGTEGAVKATFYKTAYIEFSNKLDYASYSGLKVYEGKAKQAFGTYEWILSLGVCFGGRNK